MSDSQELWDRLQQVKAQRGKSHASSAPLKPEPKLEATYDSSKVSIGEGERAYTDVFGESATGREYALPQYKDTDWPEWAQPYIPEPLAGYIFPKEQTEELVTGLFITSKRAQLLYGPKGSGKSSLTEQICAVLRIPFFRVNMSQDAESGRVFGTVDVQEGSMGWIPGAAEMAATAAEGAILQVDEVSACPPGVNLSMQWMLEADGKIFLADKPNNPGKYGERMITPGENFRVVCTDNTQLQGDTTGKYRGTNVQNEAFLDRMQAAIYLGYLSREHEEQVVMGRCPDVPKNIVDQMLRIAQMVRSSYDAGEMQYTMSPRGLIEWAKETMFWGDLKRGFKTTFFAKLIQEDQEVAKKHYYDVVGEHI